MSMYVWIAVTTTATATAAFTMARPSPQSLIAADPHNCNNPKQPIAIPYPPRFGTIPASHPKQRIAKHSKAKTRHIPLRRIVTVTA